MSRQAVGRIQPSSADTRVKRSGLEAENLGPYRTEIKMQAAEHPFPHIS
jgi:hypothetical protein